MTLVRGISPLKPSNRVKVVLFRVIPRLTRSCVSMDIPKLVRYFNSKVIHYIGVEIIMTDISEDLSRKGIERKAFEMFLQSRKNDKTPAYTRAILERLSDQFDLDMQNPLESQRDPNGGWDTKIFGWVRLTDLLDELVLNKQEIIDYHKRNSLNVVIPKGKERETVNKKMLAEMGKKIPNESTFYQLLKNLHESKLIEKRTEESQVGSGKKPTSYRVPGVYTYEFSISKDEFKEDLVRDLSKAHKNIVKLGTRLDAATRLLVRCHANDPGYDYKKAKRAIMEETLRIDPNYGKAITQKKKI